MSIRHFSKLVKRYLGDLPKDDYPVLDTQTFVTYWLSFTLDQSLTSMRSFFKRLNIREIDTHISTFSKASKVRDVSVFRDLFNRVKSKVMSKFNNNETLLFPLDSTTVTLTSKLM